jgi:hypothetical protein
MKLIKEIISNVISRVNIRLYVVMTETFVRMTKESFRFLPLPCMTTITSMDIFSHASSCN